ncbi:uncharacterized protein FOBCDRAFT_256092 [Fusarium oxysporum Fo47]|uniref:uncharacterized protein n=1 Tax=Fusarium oxysporum Fo47 TaxID=660027 RepID=UPI002869A000|nr:uncharacterized protein FOBCDRAFT_256092 [Fusarium oxysporum Fo47]QKD48045.2 hypothetical protein FOBCDRAFT_256092 [Fusarium oxysporum Fo47]
MPPFAGSVDKDEDVPMAGNPPSESLAGIEEAAPLYLEYITSESTRNDLLSIMPGNNLTTYAFCAVAEESDAAKLEILEAITEYFQDPAPGKSRETFIVSPFDDNINFLVRYRAHSHGWSLAILEPSDLIRDVPAWLVHLLDRVFDIMRLRIPYFEPKGFRWFLHQRFVHFGTDPSNTLFPLMFPRIEEVRSDCFWEFAGKESRSQLYGDGLNLVDCSESMLEDQLAGDEGEGSQVQPRSRDRSRSPPSLRRSSRVKRRRINYSEVSDINVDLRAKSSHDDKDDLHSDCEQESHLTSVEQSETVEFSSPEDAVPDAYGSTTANAAIVWVLVSIVAEGLAPSDLKGLYTPEACSQLYESDENAEFRRKALLGPNWERLRGASSFEGEQPQEGGPFGLKDVDSGTYGRCLAFLHRLAEHEPLCVGRCLACVRWERRLASPVLHPKNAQSLRTKRKHCQRGQSNVTCACSLWETSILTSASVVVDARTALQKRCLAREETLQDTTNARITTPKIKIVVTLRMTRKGLV